MKKVLVFPDIKGQLLDILKKSYQVIPVSTQEELQEYSWISEVLIVDVTYDYNKAKDFINSLNINNDLGIISFVSNKEPKHEREFLQLGVSSVIKEDYPIEIIHNRISQVMQNIKNKKELMNLKNNRTLENNISKDTGNNFDITHRAFMQAVKREEILQDFSKILTVGYDLNKLLDVFLNVLQEMLKVSRIAIFLEQNEEYKIKVYRGISSKIIEHISLLSSGEAIKYLKREGTILRLNSMQAGDIHFIPELRSMGIVTIVPLWENGRMIGLIGLNNKITGLSITDEELELVFALCNQVAVAIENIKLVEITSKQKKYLENILENVSCGIITVNTRKEILTYNPKAEEILNINRNIIGKTLDSLPGDVSNLLQETISEGTACYRKELKLENSEKFIGVSSTPIKADRGEITGCVMIFTDLSPIKELERETRRSDQLEFTNTVAMRSSHELKNCLVSIKTFAQLLPERYMDKQFREDFYLVVDKEVDRLNQVVENLLFFAQPLQLDTSSCSVEELIRDVELILEKEDLLEGIEIVKEFTHKEGVYNIDKDAMLRALKGLLYNSMQAMPKGGKIRIVTNDTVEDKNKLFSELKIIDSGVGIEPNILDKIWDPFFTTKGRGIGLGLTITRKIIEAHGGRITISSQPKEGTEVTILLPQMLQAKENKTLYFPSGRRVVV